MTWQSNFYILLLTFYSPNLRTTAILLFVFMQLCKYSLFFAAEAIFVYVTMSCVNNYFIDCCFVFKMQTYGNRLFNFSFVYVNAVELYDWLALTNI